MFGLILQCLKDYHISRPHFVVYTCPGRSSYCERTREGITVRRIAMYGGGEGAGGQWSVTRNYQQSDSFEGISKREMVEEPSLVMCNRKCLRERHTDRDGSFSNRLT